MGAAIFRVSTAESRVIYPSYFKMRNSVGIKIDLDTDSCSRQNPRQLRPVAESNICRSSGLNQEYLTRYKSILNPSGRRL